MRPNITLPTTRACPAVVLVSGLYDRLQHCSGQDAAVLISSAVLRSHCSNAQNFRNHNLKLFHNRGAALTLMETRSTLF